MKKRIDEDKLWNFLMNFKMSDGADVVNEKFKELPNCCCEEWGGQQIEDVIYILEAIAKETPSALALGVCQTKLMKY